MKKTLIKKEKDLNKEGKREPNNLTDKERQIVCFSQSIEFMASVKSRT